MISDVFKLLKKGYLDALFAGSFLLFLYINHVDVVWLQIATVFVSVFILLINVKYYVKFLEKFKLFLKNYLAEITLLSLAIMYFLINPGNAMVSTSLVLCSIVALIIINSHYAKKKIGEILGSVLSKRREGLLIVLFALLLMILSIKLDLVLFIVVFLAFLFYKWDSRVVALGAIICLFLCPPLLFFEYGLLAEQMAVYAYYFLLVTVILQIVEYKRDEGKA